MPEAGKPLPPVLLRSGHRVYCAPEDTASYLIYEIFIRNCYIDADFYVPQSADTVLDIGAHIGLFALSLAGKAPGIKIHCFEPCSRTRMRLRRTLQANRLERSITIYGVAVAGGGDSRVLRVGAETGHSSLYPRSSRSSLTESTRCVSLSEAVRMCGAAHIDLLKIDTEGSECDILDSGDEDTFSRIDKISLEFHDDIVPGSRERVISTLTARGFTVSRIVTAPPFTEETGIIQARR